MGCAKALVELLGVEAVHAAGNAHHDDVIVRSDRNFHGRLLQADFRWGRVRGQELLDREDVAAQRVAPVLQTIGKLPDQVHAQAAEARSSAAAPDIHRRTANGSKGRPWSSRVSSMPFVSPCRMTRTCSVIEPGAPSG